MMTQTLRSNVLVPANSAQDLLILGHLQAHKLDSQQTGGAFSVWIENVPAESSGPPPHVHHYEDEVFYVLDGEVTFVDATGETRAPQGTLFYSPRGNWHSFRNDQKLPARMLLFVTPGGLEEYFQSIDVSSTASITQPLPPDPATIEKALTLAPQYGIEFQVS